MAVGIELDSGFIRPDRQPERRMTPKVNTVSFGDGYDYRLPIGYNNLEMDIRLTFNNREIDDIDELEEFFENKLGATAFDYTYIQGKNQDGTVKEKTISVVCPEWRVTNRTMDIGSLSCALRRVYG